MLASVPLTAIEKVVLSSGMSMRILSRLAFTFGTSEDEPLRSLRVKLRLAVDLVEEVVAARRRDLFFFFCQAIDVFTSLCCCYDSTGCLARLEALSR